MRIEFTKMSGAGNDFVVVDNRGRKIRNGARAARVLCDRRWGIGADGLLLLQKSRKADYRMMYYNADGSYGGMCGNGGRCIALYAVLNQIAPKNHKFDALGYTYEATVQRRKVSLRMKDPKGLMLKKKIRLGRFDLSVAQVNTGSPHVVIDAQSRKPGLGRLAGVDVMGIGSEVRNHRAFRPQGTNVNFIEVSGRKTISMRTFERGVEDETLACGTGSIASAIVASKWWGLKPPVDIMTQSGRKLVVDFKSSNEKIRDVVLAGPAEVIFVGEIEV
jgi:diaminopimelate epimerase